MTWTPWAWVSPLLPPSKLIRTAKPFCVCFSSGIRLHSVAMTAEADLQIVIGDLQGLPEIFFTRSPVADDVTFLWPAIPSHINGSPCVLAGLWVLQQEQIRLGRLRLNYWWWFEDQWGPATPSSLLWETKGCCSKPFRAFCAPEEAWDQRRKAGSLFFSLYFLKSVLEIKEPTDLLQSLAHNSRIWRCSRPGIGCTTPNFGSGQGDISQNVCEDAQLEVPLVLFFFEFHSFVVNFAVNSLLSFGFS